MNNAVNYIDRMIILPGVQPHIREFSYHRYAGVSLASLQAIAQRGAQYGVRTAMLEHIGSDYIDLHQDLKVGMNSAWQQYVLGYCSTSDTGSEYYRIDESDPTHPIVIMGTQTKYFRQYFKYVRRGAVRIQASSNNSTFDPLAFINNDGTYVVVVKASQGGSLSIQGLPAGNYGVYYTIADQYNAWPGDVSLSAGQVLNTAIPAAGVITIFRRLSNLQPAYLPLVRKK